MKEKKYETVAERLVTDEPVNEEELLFAFDSRNYDEMADYRVEEKPTKRPGRKKAVRIKSPSTTYEIRENEKGVSLRIKRRWYVNGIRYENLKIMQFVTVLDAVDGIKAVRRKERRLTK